MRNSITVNSSLQTLFFRPNKIKGVTPASAPNLARAPILVSAAAALLVLASCGYGVLFAYQVGSKHNVLLAIISVAMALGLEISKPFAIHAAFRSLREWKIIQAAALALVGLLAVGYSLQAELSFAAQTRGDMVAERAGEHDAAKKAGARYDRAEAELAGLTPTRPAAELAAEIAAIDMLPGIMIDGVPCGGTLNGKITKEQCPKRAALVAERARAERRAALEAAMREAEQEQKGAPGVAVADPGAVALATYASALGAKIDPDQLGLWLPLIGVLALEIGAAFSIVLVQTTRTAAPQREALNDHADDAEGQPGPTQGPPAITDDAAAQERVKQAILAQLAERGGQAPATQRGLAAVLNTSRPTVRRAIHGLVLAGLVAAEATRNGTMLRLVA